MPTLSAFGQQLRSWRHRRGMSQLDLAVSAASTPRYVSFVETGRARPGRDLILRFASALDVPLREKNAMLVAAGLPAEFSTRELDDELMRPVRRVIDSLLRKHEPFPAWCVSRGLRILDVNRAARRLFPGLVDLAPEQFIEMWFAPGPFRDMVENWQDVLHSGVAVLRREVLRHPDPELVRLFERALEHTRGLERPPPSAEVPVVCPIFRIDGQRIRTLTTVVRFDNAVEVTASELKLELMFPGDEASEAFFRRRAAEDDEPG